LASERLGERAWKLRLKPLGSIGEERLECAPRFKDRPSFFILYRGPEGGRRGTLIASLYVAAADDFDAGGHLDEDDPERALS
jgi:hypothetical protein